MAYVKDITFFLLCGHDDCKYAGKLGSESRRYCNYMEIAGHSRPCKATWNCECFEKGEYEQIVKHIRVERV